MARVIHIKYRPATSWYENSMTVDLNEFFPALQKKVRLLMDVVLMDGNYKCHVEEIKAALHELLAENKSYFQYCVDHGAGKTKINSIVAKQKRLKRNLELVLSLTDRGE